MYFPFFSLRHGGKRPAAQPQTIDSEFPNILQIRARGLRGSGNTGLTIFSSFFFLRLHSFLRPLPFFGFLLAVDGSLALGLGEYAAPMGTGAALVILACGLFLWTQKDAHMSASISFLVTCAVIAFFFPRQAGLADSAVLSNILPRLQCVRDELLTGAILFSAVFLINEPYTCVHHRMGRVLYGVLVGVVSMGFRYYGVYETGVCFALLVVNSVSAWIDRTEAKLYHLTHLQADAGKGAAQ